MIDSLLQLFKQNIYRNNIIVMTARLFCLVEPVFGYFVIKMADVEDSSSRFLQAMGLLTRNQEKLQSEGRMIRYLVCRQCELAIRRDSSVNLYQFLR